MSADPDRLEQLIESIADGAAVDWNELDASTEGREARLLRHLRVVAGVADVHRTLATVEAADTRDPWSDLGASGQAIPRWGHLLLMEKIGEGAFGEVYRARDPWLERDVALKLLKAEVADQVPPARLVTEARTLARVQHANVVTVYGADMHDGRSGVWMELVRGRTLAQIVSAQGPFSASEAAVIGQEVCRALSAVHAAGLVHRDVKAQNVMREAGGRLVLMDFGAGGTPLYLAPELLAGGPPTVQSDVYAVGVLLYHLVTGHYPVRGASLDELRRMHAAGRRRRLGDQRADLPDGFVAVVERALESDPARRPATVTELQSALRSAMPLTAGNGLRPASDVSRVRRSRTLPAAVGVFVVVAGVMLALWPSTVNQPVARDSVAVLPLRPIGADPETVFYSEGLSEDLTAQLARLASVRVVSGVSVRRYRDTDRPPGDIGRELMVAALVSGSVRLSPDRVRVVVELVDTEHAQQLWAGTFDRLRDDVVAIQTEVVQQVAQALKGTLTAQDASRLERREPDPRAFDLYLKGRYYWNTRTPDGIRRSIEYFTEAVAVDPAAALPYAGLADAYMLAAFYYLEWPETAFAQGEAAALQALRLDAGLAQAHAALGALRLCQLRWTEAEESLRRAIALNASYASAHHWYAVWLAQRGRLEEALVSIRAARAADPFSQVLRAATGYFLYVARDFDTALREYEQVLDVDPADFYVHAAVIDTLVARGTVQDAIEALEVARRRTNRDDDLGLAAAYVYAHAGNRAEALRHLANVQARLDTRPASQADIASVYAVLDERDRAFEWLARARAAGDTQLGYLAVDPRFDRLRSDARFTTLLDSLDLGSVQRGDR